MNRCTLGRFCARAVFVFVSFFVASAPTASHPQAEKSAPPGDTLPPVTKISDNVFRIGKLVVDGNTREVSLPGWVNMREGVIELLACSPKGKTHESVLVFDVEPYHLQVALLLIGLEAKGGLEYQGDPRTPEGDPIDIFVEWADSASGERRSCRAEDLVYNVKDGEPMTHTHWIFAGSRVLDGVFAAQVDGSLVTTYHDPNTIIDNPLPTGSDDTYYEANRMVLPPPGTAVQVKIKARD
jgi:hypothetical protein